MVETALNTKVHPDTDLTQGHLEVLVNRLISRRGALVDMHDTLDQKIAARDDCSITEAVDAGSIQDAHLRASGIADQHRQTINRSAVRSAG